MIMIIDVRVKELYLQQLSCNLTELQKLMEAGRAAIFWSQFWFTAKHPEAVAACQDLRTRKSAPGGSCGSPRLMHPEISTRRQLHPEIST